MISYDAYARMKTTDHTTRRLLLAFSIPEYIKHTIEMVQYKAQ